MELNKQATTLFKPDRQFSIDPGHSFDFCADFMKYGKAYGYIGLLKMVPTNQAVDADNPNALTYSDYINLLKAWNEIGIKTIQKHANEMWGTRDWASLVSNAIVDFS